MDCDKRTSNKQISDRRDVSINTNTNTNYRRISYSDSFFFLPPPPDIECDSSELIVSSVSTNTPTHCAIWTIRALSFGFHICLIGIFETLFFFLFISKSEDDGIQMTIQNYIQGILNQCKQWSLNDTVTINTILQALVNTTQVQTDATRAMTERTLYNHNLEVQAWMYVAGIASCLCLGGAVAHLVKIRIPVRRILLENLSMVALLGLYELMFFKTIIYKYRSLTFEELNGNIVGQLQGSCGLLQGVST
jgi:hypothetical protein